MTRATARRQGAVAFSILDALEDRELFGALPAFRDLSTWRAWLTFLKAMSSAPEPGTTGAGFGAMAGKAQRDG